MADLEAKSFSPAEAYSNDFFESLLLAEGHIVLVDFDHGSQNGFVAAVVEKGEAHVLDIVVDHRCRNKGIGKSLLLAVEKAVEGKVQFLYAEARAGNTTSIKCFRSCGYFEDERVKSYYNDPQEDAVIMRKRARRIFL